MDIGNSKNYLGIILADILLDHPEEYLFVSRKEKRMEASLKGSIQLWRNIHWLAGIGNSRAVLLVQVYLATAKTEANKHSAVFWAGCITADEKWTCTAAHEHNASNAACSWSISYRMVATPHSLNWKFAFEYSWGHDGMWNDVLHYRQDHNPSKMTAKRFIVEGCLDQDKLDRRHRIYRCQSHCLNKQHWAL